MESKRVPVELLTAANALCKKLRLIHDNPLYESVWQVAANHGVDYTNGPTYTHELDRLEKAIKAAPAHDGDRITHTRSDGTRYVSLTDAVARQKADGRFDRFKSVKLNAPAHEVTDFNLYTSPKSEFAGEGEEVEMLRESIKRHEKCFVRIARTFGIDTPLMLMAENDEENYAEILTRHIEKSQEKDNE